MHSIWGMRNRMLDILFSFYYYLMKVEHLTFTGYIRIDSYENVTLLICVDILFCKFNLILK